MKLGTTLTLGMALSLAACNSPEAQQDKARYEEYDQAARSAPKSPLNSDVIDTKELSYTSNDHISLNFVIEFTPKSNPNIACVTNVTEGGISCFPKAGATATPTASATPAP